MSQYILEKLCVGTGDVELVGINEITIDNLVYTPLSTATVEG